MKKLRLNATLLLCAAILSACSGGSTEIVDYAPPQEPTGLDMKATIYKVNLPSGNILTLTTDQSGNNVFGAYTIKKTDGTFVSSGTVGNLVSQLNLLPYKYLGNPCPNEQMTITIDDNNVNSSRDAAEITISGVSCSEVSLLPATKTISKYNPPATATMHSQGTSNIGQELNINLVSGDNVNFVGSVTLNPLLPDSAKGTIVATATNSGLGNPVKSPNTTPVTEIKNATGLYFTRILNTNGKFFTVDPTSMIGQIKTVTSGNQTFMTELLVSSFKDGAPSQQLGPIINPVSIQSYTSL